MQCRWPSEAARSPGSALAVDLCSQVSSVCAFHRLVSRRLTASVCFVFCCGSFDFMVDWSDDHDDLFQSSPAVNTMELDLLLQEVQNKDCHPLMRYEAAKSLKDLCQYSQNRSTVARAYRQQFIDGLSIMLQDDDEDIVRFAIFAIQNFANDSALASECVVVVVVLGVSVLRLVMICAGLLTILDGGCLCVLCTGCSFQGCPRRSSTSKCRPRRSRRRTLRTICTRSLRLLASYEERERTRRSAVQGSRAARLASPRLRRPRCLAFLDLEWNVLLFPPPHFESPSMSRRERRQHAPLSSVRRRSCGLSSTMRYSHQGIERQANGVC